MSGRIIQLSAAVAGLLAGTSSALAASPEVYQEARQGAAHHVQLRISKVGDLPWYADHGPCDVQGRVVRVFSGDLAEGDELTIRVDCAKPRARLPDGPALWTSQRALADASVIEAYLDEARAVASWQTMLLSEPSDEPSCPVDAEGSC
jgi:hypothetical protein